MFHSSSLIPRFFFVHGKWMETSSYFGWKRCSFCERRSCKKASERASEHAAIYLGLGRLRGGRSRRIMFSPITFVYDLGIFIGSFVPHASALCYGRNTLCTFRNGSWEQPPRDPRAFPHLQFVHFVRSPARSSLRVQDRISFTGMAGRQAGKRTNGVVRGIFSATLGKCDCEGIRYRKATNRSIR